MNTYRQWNSPGGRYTVSVGDAEWALPLSVSNGVGGFSIRLLNLDIVRWKNRMMVDLRAEDND